MIKMMFLIIFMFIESAAYSTDRLTIQVAIAANLTTVITELKRDFEAANPAYEITPVAGSSGLLTSQILAGAPYDVFLSADMGFPEKLFKNGATVTNPVPYAYTSLVLFTVQGFPVTNGLSVLTNPGVKKIAIANPALAPHGMAALLALSNSGYINAVSGKLVYGENITLTAQYIVAAAEVGFITLPLLYSKDLSKYNRPGVNYQPVDTGLYPRIEQGIVLLKGSATNAGAITFYKYILSDRAKTIFKKFGYVYY